MALVYRHEPVGLKGFRLLVSLILRLMLGLLAVEGLRLNWGLQGSCQASLWLEYPPPEPALQAYATRMPVISRNRMPLGMATKLRDSCIKTYGSVREAFL